MRSLHRRGFVELAGAAGVLAIAGCAPDKPASGTAGAVTVKHRFGETSIPKPPQRVVSAGLTEQDDLLAVGVVPIAVTNWWGDQPFAVWPWAQPKLGAAQPAVLSLDTGLAFDQIAALKPDLIVAVNAGLDKDSYTKLAAIAPTLAQSGDQAFFQPWQEQAKAVGQAVFRPDQMSSLIGEVSKKFSEVAAANTLFKDKKAVLLQGTIHLDTIVATLPGWRTDFLTEMGFVIPETLGQFAVDEYRAVIPREKAAATLDGADVLIWTTESDEEAARLLADPTVAQLRATTQKHNVFTGKDLSGAVAFSSPLSLPVVAQQLPPMLAKAVG